MRTMLSAWIATKPIARPASRCRQVAGNANHAAIGTDLDGGYGTEQTPSDLDTIYDLQRVPGMLSTRGYSDADIEKIMHGNWLRMLNRVLPAG